MPPPFVATWGGGVEVADFQLSGDAFSAGSVLMGGRKGNERAGWATVMIDRHGKVIGGIYGTCPDYFPSSLRAELWGVLQTLRHACPPITIWVDNAGVVGGYAKGRRWCCDSSRPAVDLWRLVWWKVEDLGGEGGAIQIEKVKGHATEADVHAGRSTVWHKAGNDHADHFAGRGSMLAEELSSTLHDKETFKQARAWYKWLTILVANWPADTERKKADRPKDRQAGSRRTESSASTAQRVRSRSRNRHHSTSDDRTASSATTAFATQSGGRAGHRAQASRAATASYRQCVTPTASHGLGTGHLLLRSGAVVWCRTCGAYGEKRFKALRQPCNGDRSNRAGQLARMLRGEHPYVKGERLARAVVFRGFQEDRAAAGEGAAEERRAAAEERAAADEGGPLL